MRLITSLAASVLLASTQSFAQVNVILGTPLNDIINGTDGPGGDFINPGAGTDQVYDGSRANASDGVPDVINTIDGEFDLVVAGIEDSIWVDNVDRVIIHDQWGNIHFEGLGGVYNFWRSIIEELEDLYWTYQLAMDDLWVILADLYDQSDSEELDEAFYAAAMWLIDFEATHGDGPDSGSGSDSNSGD